MTGRRSRLAKPRWEKPEDADGREQGVRAGVAEPEPGHAGAGRCDERLADAGDDVLAVGRVVADFLDVQEAPGGSEADCPQRGQVVQPRVVDGGLGPGALPSLWYCLIFECL
jgi:hypothetical protein